MESPVSAVLANLVTETVEETAITTSKTPPKWWHRYADDSHSCVKRDKVDDFHTHLNSIDQHIKFTLETEEDQTLPFLDTLTARTNDQIQVEVHGKPTHTTDTSTTTLTT